MVRLLHNFFEPNLPHFYISFLSHFNTFTGVKKHPKNATNNYANILAPLES